jgi:hypothetical protein
VRSLPSEFRRDVVAVDRRSDASDEERAGTRTPDLLIRTGAEPPDVELSRRGLLDRDEDGYLLQIFTKLTVIAR